MCVYCKHVLTVNHTLISGDYAGERGKRVAFCCAKAGLGVKWSFLYTTTISAHLGGLSMCLGVPGARGQVRTTYARHTLGKAVQTH